MSEPEKPRCPEILPEPTRWRERDYETRTDWQCFKPAGHDGNHMLKDTEYSAEESQAARAAAIAGGYDG